MEPKIQIPMTAVKDHIKKVSDEGVVYEGNKFSESHLNEAIKEILKVLGAINETQGLAEARLYLLLVKRYKGPWCYENIHTLMYRYLKYVRYLESKKERDSGKEGTA
jgi:hypothetical protein